MKTVYKMPPPATADSGFQPAHDAAEATEALATAGQRPVAARSAASGQRALPQPGLTQRSAFLPLLLCGLSVLGWQAFQTTLLLRDHQALQASHAGQQQTVDSASKLRGSLDTLAADTQRMAEAGNANARLLVEELRKRGVTISAPAAAAAVPPK
jgi:hypothetical protein